MMTKMSQKKRDKVRTIVYRNRYRTFSENTLSDIQTSNSIYDRRWDINHLFDLGRFDSNFIENKKHLIQKWSTFKPISSLFAATVTEQVASTVRWAQCSILMRWSFLSDPSWISYCVTSKYVIDPLRSSHDRNRVYVDK